MKYKAGVSYDDPKQKIKFQGAMRARKYRSRKKATQQTPLSRLDSIYKKFSRSLDKVIHLTYRNEILSTAD